MKAKLKKPVTVKKEWQSSLDSFFSTTKKKNPPDCAVVAAAVGAASTANSVAVTSTIDAITTSQTDDQSPVSKKDVDISPQAAHKKRAREQDEVHENGGNQKLRVSAPAASETLVAINETPSFTMPDIQMAEMSLSDKPDTAITIDSNGSLSNHATVEAQVTALTACSPEIIDLATPEPENNQEMQDISMSEVSDLKVEPDMNNTKTASVEEQAKAVPVRVTNAGCINPGMCIIRMFNSIVNNYLRRS